MDGKLGSDELGITATGAFEDANAGESKIVEITGLTLTGAGAAFPYGIDPQDSHLRIAPTYPSLSEVETASMLLTVCVRLAVVEKLLAE